jgi:curved DNA-binding protein
MAKDYYNVLGVNKNADQDELKRAYRKLAKQYHPDANKDDPTAEERFKEVNEAYDVLKDPDQRRAYDQFGPNFRNFNGGNGAGGANPYGQNVNVNFDDVPFEDIFGSIFGNMGRRGTTTNRGGGGFEYGPFGGAAAPGRDIEHDITISLREAYEGTSRYITKDGRRIKVNIPAGANNGTKVRLSGEGERGAGGTGDLYLIVNVQPDPTFERDGDDLYVEVQVDAITAMLGGTAKVPTMERPVKVKIAPGSQSGLKLRLTGKGMPKLKHKGEHGNLYARVQLTVPEKLTDEQRHLVEQLRDSLNSH